MLFLHRLLFKAKKVPVGSVTKRKDGKYQKVGEHDWKKLAELVREQHEKDSLPAANEHAKRMQVIAKQLAEHLAGHEAPADAKVHAEFLKPHAEKHEYGDKWVKRVSAAMKKYVAHTGIGKKPLLDEAGVEEILDRPEVKELFSHHLPEAHAPAKAPAPVLHDPLAAGAAKPKGGFKPSPYQQKVYDWIQHGSGSAIIDAKAGSGKSTTIVHALKMLPKGDSVIFLAFNKSAEQELKEKLGKEMPEAVGNVRTLNSLGNMAWGRYMKTRTEVDASKMSQLTRMVVGEDRTYFEPVQKLAKMCKQMGLVPKLAGSGYSSLVADTDDSMWKIMEHFDIEFGEGINDSQAFSYVRQVLKKSIEQKTVIDFDDMFYMPIIHNAPFPKFDWLFVDEAQDVSDIQREMLKRSSDKRTRLVAVGDPHQAIYGFRGANPESLFLIRDEFKAKTFELPVSYRCPKKVVELAQKIVPGIKARDDAPEGIVKDLGENFELKEFRKTDLIVCRNNAPIVNLAYKLIAAQVPCRVIGRDIGTGLVNLIKKMKAKSLGELVDRLANWREKQIALTQRKDPDADITGIEDKFETVHVFIATSPAKTVEGLIEEIEAMFNPQRVKGVSDDVEAKNLKVLRLSSVHRAKGLEAPRVFILNRHLMPSKMAKKPWQKVQEANLEYVAVTRALEELYFIDKEPPPVAKGIKKARECVYENLPIEPVKFTVKGVF